MGWQTGIHWLPSTDSEQGKHRGRVFPTIAGKRLKTSYTTGGWRYRITSETGGESNHNNIHTSTQNREGQAGFLRNVMSVKSIPICFVF